MPALYELDVYKPRGFDTFVNLRPTMLDDSSWFVPFIETMTSEKLPWAITPAIHSFEEWPAFEEYKMLTEENAKQVAGPATR